MKAKTEKKEIIHHPLKLYTDGGVISKNPSPYGGTWAWVLVHEDKIVASESGILPAKDGPVTNNQTELLAIIEGLQEIPLHSVAEICSDSNVSLGRVFRGSSFNNIPFWMETRLKQSIKYFSYWNQFSYTLLDGHPTKAQLASGVGRHGHPVSKWNKLADDLCRAEADRYWNEQNQNR